MAGAVLPWERQCQLRTQVVRGAASVRCDLWHCYQRQHIGHRRSTERQHFFYSVLLQRLRRRGYRRAKLYLFPTTLPNANPIVYSNGHRDSNLYGYTYSYSHTYTNSYSHAHTNVNSYTHGYCNGNIHAYANTNSYSHAYANSYSYSYGNRNCYGDAYGHGDSDRNGYSNASAESNANGNVYFYSKTLSDSKRYPATKASANSAAAPVA